MKKLLVLLMSFVFILSAGSAFAQGCDDDEPIGGDDEGKPKIFGFIQPQYEFHFSDNSETEYNEMSNSFKFKRARIGIKGNIPYDFKYYVVLENSAFVSGSGYPYLLDAFVSYTRFKWAKISMGSFKQPFGMETNTACHSLYTINRAGASDQIVAPQRDMGLMISGGDNESLLKYSFAIMNGYGLSIKDNNPSKDFIGRLVFKPLDFLRIGGSFRYGFPNPEVVATNTIEERISYAGELELKFGNFVLQGEYIADEGAYNIGGGGGCGADPILLGDKRSGAFVQAMYMLPFNLQPVVKWEYFDQDLENNKDDIIISNIDNTYAMTFGINYFFNDNTRLQLNYVYNVEKGVEGAYVEEPNDALMLQMQIKF